MSARRFGVDPSATREQLVRSAEKAVANLHLSSGGLRGFWLLATREQVTLSSKMLVQEEFGCLERVLAAMPEIFQAGISMELLGTHEDEPPIEFKELILVSETLVAIALHDQRGRFAIAAILAPSSNIALELNGLRAGLAELETVASGKI